MLWLRGVNIFEGYLHDPERTAQVLRDGWLKTGDVVEVSAMAFDGTLVNISNSPGYDNQPSFTPDGKAVIFLRGGARDPVLAQRLRC